MSLFLSFLFVFCFGVNVFYIHQYIYVSQGYVNNNSKVHTIWMENSFIYLLGYHNRTGFLAATKHVAGTSTSYQSDVTGN
jgi:hypothetical protein